MSLTESIIERVNKIISSIILTISDTVAEIDQILILLTQEENKILLTIRIFNEHKSLSKYLIDKLINKSTIDLDTKNVNTYLTLLLLENYNAEISFNYESNLIEINVSILSGV
nr:hypothetical protein [Wolbachia endosymbiont of Chironomus riparius]